MIPLPVDVKVDSSGFTDVITQLAKLNNHELHRVVNRLARLGSSFAVAKGQNAKIAITAQGRILSEMRAPARKRPRVKQRAKKGQAKPKPLPGSKLDEVEKKMLKRAGKVASEWRGTFAAQIYAIRRAKARAKMAKRGEKWNPQTAGEFYRAVRRMVAARMRSRGYHRWGQIKALRLFRPRDGSSVETKPPVGHIPGDAKLATPDDPVAVFMNNARDVVKRNPQAYEKVIAEVQVLAERFMLEDFMRVMNKVSF